MSERVIFCETLNHVEMAISAVMLGMASSDWIGSFGYAENQDDQ